MSVDRESGKISQIVAGLLWLGSGPLGLYAVYSCYKLAGTVYALMGDQYYAGVFFSQAAALVSGFAWLIGFVMLGEYQRKHAGEPGVWKFTAWMLGIEGLFIFLGLVFG